GPSGSRADAGVLEGGWAEARGDDEEDRGAGEVAVEDERAVAVGADEAEEPGDREVTGDSGGGGADDHRAGDAAGEAVVDRFPRFEDRRPEDDRDQQQEREPGRGIAVEAEVAGSGDRDPRPRGAGGERQHLGKADIEPIPDRRALERLSLGEPVRVP